ncbi:hypothetical protein G647_02037 [Cladophialophora carrionii CBS 160.54]|uniref:WW domain-containing protein n=1 Tax=Cladophialophora carrionii CBS 160.54 TaxID=1279043 RepID=V9DRR4_9EURO|nr:uncharacterized protein G647_02037 [Cladophialophora carrionii CBS 160.54]ETI29584.1 hypothetical protein G647_02037 [Cladophialophora carrionii CBS 160.54]
MSFFKKLKDELKEMLNDDDDKDKKKDGEHKQKDEGGHGHSDTRDVHNQPPPDMYGQYQPQQPYPSYGSPPPSGPPLPPGWIAQWDQNSQRYYYVEQATGRTQWEPPIWQGSPPPAPPGGPGYYQSYGHAMPPGVPYQQGHDENQRAYYGDVRAQEKKGHGMGTVLAAGVGGAVVGALAANALDDSDDEHRAASAAPAPAPYGYGAPPPAAAPVPLEDNPELSSSQRESLEEAREDLEEAQRNVDEEGSSASSSDIEDLQEAREEYHSEVESAHEELED